MMKKLIFLLAALLTGATSPLTASTDDKVAVRNAFNYGNSFIFVENGITFSVYPDGEFDFYIDNRVNVNAQIGVGPVGVTFNSGFDYNPFVQYDDYGAIIQVENIPVYYDYYGRVNRIGAVNILYRNGLAYRIGGMRIFYNPRGIYDYHTGFINIYNRGYVFRPWHRYFSRPALGFCMVYNRPYRRYYSPVRYTYYRPYQYNRRRAYAAVGKTYRYAPRAERSRVYRNDSRVAVRNDRVRSNNRIAGTQRPDVRSNQDRSTQVNRRQSAVRQGNSEVRGNQRAVRSNSSAQARRSAPDTRTVKRSTRDTRTVKRSTRDVRTTPRGNSVQSSRTTTVRKTEARQPVPQRTATVKRTAQARKTTEVRRSAPTRKAPQTRGKAPSRTVRQSAVQSSRRSGSAMRSGSSGRSNGRGSQ